MATWSRLGDITDLIQEYPDNHDLLAEPHQTLLNFYLDHASDILEIKDAETRKLYAETTLREHLDKIKDKVQLATPDQYGEWNRQADLLCWRSLMLTPPGTAIDEGNLTKAKKLRDKLPFRDEVSNSDAQKSCLLAMHCLLAGHAAPSLLVPQVLEPLAELNTLERESAGLPALTKHEEEEFHNLRGQVRDEYRKQFLEPTFQPDEKILVWLDGIVGNATQLHLLAQAERGLDQDGADFGEIRRQLDEVAAQIKGDVSKRSGEVQRWHDEIEVLLCCAIRHPVPGRLWSGCRRLSASSWERRTAGISSTLTHSSSVPRIRSFPTPI